MENSTQKLVLISDGSVCEIVSGTETNLWLYVERLKKKWKVDDVLVFDIEYLPTALMSKILIKAVFSERVLGD